MKQPFLLIAMGAIISLLPLRAEAIPALARKTGMGCPACHDAWPKLNDVGELYRDRGYIIGADTDDNIWNRSLDYFPLSLRTSVGYQFMSTTHQATDSGSRTLNNGGFFFPGVDVLAAQNFGRHISGLVVLTGFGADQTATLESAWARFNELGTTWLNLRVGKHEFDLPASAHRPYSLTSQYLIYGWRPAATGLGYSMGDNHFGLELLGHPGKPGFRYAVSFVTLDTNTASGAFSQPNLYAHLTYTVLPRSRFFSRLRVGATGNLGWSPISFQMLTPAGMMPPAMPMQVNGTGTDNRKYGLVGGELGFTLGALERPFIVQAFWAYGMQDGGLVTSGVTNATWHGGFVEVSYTPVLNFTVFGRFDGVYPLQQADPMRVANSNQQEQLTAGLRYYALIKPWGSFTPHLEVSSNNIQDAPAPPATDMSPVRGMTGMAAVDFAM